MKLANIYINNPTHEAVMLRAVLWQYWGPLTTRRNVVFRTRDAIREIVNHAEAS